MATLTAIEKKRAKMLQDMKPALRAIAEEGNEKFKKFFAASAVMQYNMGVKISETLMKSAIYGDNTAKRLAEYWNIPGGYATVLGWQRMAENFSLDFVREMTSTPTPDGTFLSAQHFINVCTLTDESDRVKMIEKCHKNSLSLSDLALELKNVSGDKVRPHSRSGGRPPQLPSDAVKAVSKLGSLTTTWTNFEKAIEKDAFSEINKMPPDRVNDKTLEQLQTTRELVGDMLERGQTVAEKLDSNIERISRVLESRAEKNEATDEDGDEAEAPARKSPKSDGGIPKKKNKAKRKVAN